MHPLLAETSTGAAQVGDLAKTYSEQGAGAAVFGALCVACGVLFTGLVAALVRMVAQQAKHARELSAADKEHRGELDALHQKLFTFATESLPVNRALVELGADLKILVMEARQAAARRKPRQTGAHATLAPEDKKEGTG